VAADVIIAFDVEVPALLDTSEGLNESSVALPPALDGDTIAWAYDRCDLDELLVGNGVIMATSAEEGLSRCLDCL